MSNISLSEKIEQDLYDNNVFLVYEDMPAGIKGLYWGDEKDFLVIISQALSTNAERLCVLAEEAGHYYTSTGNILDLNNIMHRKQERRARVWAYERLVTPEKLIRGWLDYIRTPWDLADYCGVTGAFLTQALEYYRQKHWPTWHVDKYEISFEPFNIKTKD